MPSKAFSVPIGMLIKKFYCHKCGERLKKDPKTRTLTPGDPDYRKHGSINGRIHTFGDIELTEYDFECPFCGNIIDYEEQRIIGKIQKKLGKKLLSEDEISDNRLVVKYKMDRNSKIKKAIFTVIFIIVFALVIYRNTKSGDCSGSIYF